MSDINDNTSKNWVSMFAALVLGMVIGATAGSKFMSSPEKVAASPESTISSPKVDATPQKLTTTSKQLLAVAQKCRFEPTGATYCITPVCPPPPAWKRIGTC